MLPAVPGQFPGNVLVPTATLGPRREVCFLPGFPPRPLGKSPCKQFPIHTWDSGPQSGHVAPGPDNGTEDRASGEIWRSPPPSRLAGEEAAAPTSASAGEWLRNSPAREALQVHGPSSCSPQEDDAKRRREAGMEHCSARAWSRRDRRAGARQADRETAEQSPRETLARLRKAPSRPPGRTQGSAVELAADMQPSAANTPRWPLGGCRPRRRVVRTSGLEAPGQRVAAQFPFAGSSTDGPAGEARWAPGVRWKLALRPRPGSPETAVRVGRCVAHLGDVLPPPGPRRRPHACGRGLTPSTRKARGRGTPVCVSSAPRTVTVRGCSVCPPSPACRGARRTLFTRVGHVAAAGSSHEARWAPGNTGLMADVLRLFPSAGVPPPRPRCKHTKRASPAGSWGPGASSVPAQPFTAVPENPKGFALPSPPADDLCH